MTTKIEDHEDIYMGSQCLKQKQNRWMSMKCHSMPPSFPPLVLPSLCQVLIVRSVISTLKKILQVSCSRGCLDKHCQPKHLLWAFYFFKTYLSDSVLACHLHTDEKTIWKWVWYIIVALLNLEGDVVSLASSLCLFDCHVFARILTFVIFWRKIKWEDRLIGDVGATHC